MTGRKTQNQIFPVHLTIAQAAIMLSQRRLPILSTMHHDNEDVDIVPVS